MRGLTKKVVVTKKSPKALGPYSQAITYKDLVFVSGQLGINPLSGDFIAEDIAGQTKQALINIQNILQAANSDMSLIVKTTVFLKNMEGFKEMNEVYGTFFSKNQPARSTIAASGLPKNALCEIECIALKK